MRDQNHTLLSLKEAQAAFKSLNLAIIEHTKWLVHWNKYIVCDVELTEKDLSECAADHCGFGRWLYSSDANFLKDLMMFQQVELLHNQVHLHVDGMMKNAANGLPITQQHFEVYVDVEKELSKYMIDLRDEIYRQIFSFDYLTSTLTRQAIFDVLYKEYARISRNDESTCIVLIDLDHFKQINDKYGHQVGDEVLKFVTDYFSRHLRPYDSIGRYGGEEFILCLPDVTLEDAGIFMERLRQDLSQQEIRMDQGVCLSATVSMGIAPMLPSESVKAVIKHADRVLYQAKKQGRNRVELWSGN